MSFGGRLMNEEDRSTRGNRVENLWHVKLTRDSQRERNANWERSPEKAVQTFLEFQLRDFDLKTEELPHSLMGLTERVIRILENLLSQFNFYKSNEFYVDLRPGFTFFQLQKKWKKNIQFKREKVWPARKMLLILLVFFCN